MGGLDLIYPLNSATTSSPNPLPCPSTCLHFSPVPFRKPGKKKEETVNPSVNARVPGRGPTSLGSRRTGGSRGQALGGERAGMGRVSLLRKEWHPAPRCWDGPGCAPRGKAGLTREHHRYRGHRAGDAPAPCPRRAGAAALRGEVPSCAQRRRSGNPIKGPDPASSPLLFPPFLSFPFLPSPTLPCAGASLAAPLRSAPAPAPSSGAGGTTRRTWRWRAAAAPVTAAAASPLCCFWLRASGPRRCRGGASPGGKVGRVAVQGGRCPLPASLLHPAKFRVPLKLASPRAWGSASGAPRRAAVGPIVCEMNLPVSSGAPSPQRVRPTRRAPLAALPCSPCFFPLYPGVREDAQAVAADVPLKAVKLQNQRTIHFLRHLAPMPVGAPELQTRTRLPLLRKGLAKFVSVFFPEAHASGAAWAELGARWTSVPVRGFLSSGLCFCCDIHVRGSQ